jgi:hypothetical protein
VSCSFANTGQVAAPRDERNKQLKRNILSTLNGVAAALALWVIGPGYAQTRKPNIVLTWPTILDTAKSAVMAAA